MQGKVSIEDSMVELQSLDKPDVDNYLFSTSRTLHESALTKMQ